MKSKLARILRKWADLVDPRVRPTDIGTLTVRIEADTQDFMKEMEIVKRVAADLAAVHTNFNPPNAPEEMKPISVGSVEADPQDLERMVRRVVADVAAAGAKASQEAIAKHRARKPKAK